MSATVYCLLCLLSVLPDSRETCGALDSGQDARGYWEDTLPRLLHGRPGARDSAPGTVPEWSNSAVLAAGLRPHPRVRFALSGLPRTAEIKAWRPKQVMHKSEEIMSLTF